MKYEWERTLRSPALWLILSASLGIRCVIAVYDRMYRFDSFWDLAVSYWEIIGALTLILMILLAPIKLFTDDKHYSMNEMILSARKGRWPLMARRLIVCLLFALTATAFLGTSNYIISAIIGGGPTVNITAYWHTTVQAAVGGMGLALAAGALCDVLRSHPAALIICGAFTLIGFMIRGNMIHPFDFLWFIKCGFFTPLLRGQAIALWNGWFLFWSVWHISMILIFLFFDVYKRRERKAL